MEELRKIQKYIIKDLKTRKNNEDEMAAVGIMLVLEHTNKEEEFFKYLQKHTEQDFDELMQVAFAYATEETE